jgi:pteridine reductase
MNRQLTETPPSEGTPLNKSDQLVGKTALVTGGAARLGAAIARHLHAAGAHVAVHYRQSDGPAKALVDELCAVHPDSASLVQGDLLDPASWPRLVEHCQSVTGRLDVLVNNASTYYPTPVDQATIEQWDDLFGTNARAPFFLAQAAAPALRSRQGCIVNLVDIYADRPNAGHPVYCMAKAANAMMVKALAADLAPEVRVNGIAPGAALWPEDYQTDEDRARILERIPQGRPAGADQIAAAVMCMVTGPDYVTGQILAVDGGRSVQQ